MSGLIVSGVPTNLRCPSGTHATTVESDLFDICGRLAEYDANIRVTLLTKGGAHKFSVGEVGPDGVLREIFRVDELDGRVLERLMYIQSVPVSERIAAIEADFDREEASRQRDEADRLYDQIGGTIYDGIFRNGFARTPNPSSVRPLNRKARRAGRKI